METASDGKHAIGGELAFTVSALSGTSTTEIDTDISNERRTITVSVAKTDAWSGSALAGVTFGLYANEAVQTCDGNTVIVKDDLVSVAVTGEDGKLTFDTDLPVGFTWYIKEIYVPTGYCLSTDKTVVSFLDEQTTTAASVFSSALTNDPRPGELRIRKTDTEGHLLSGVTYMLEYSTDNQATWHPVYAHNNNTGVVAGGCDSAGLRSDGTLMTGSNGEVSFTGLLADGKILYRLTEVGTQNGMELLADTLFLGTLPMKEDGDFDVTPYDVSGDGVINAVDYFMLKHYLEDTGGTITLAAGSGDINGSGTITAEDAELLSAFLDEYLDPSAEVFANGRYRYGFRVVDTAVFELPMTGGGGLNWPLFAVSGAMLAASGVIVMTARRRKLGKA